MTRYAKTMSQAIAEVRQVNEKYDLYHKSFSDAMQHAYDYAQKKLGITVDKSEIDRKVATGPRKPSEGKTNKYRLKGKGGNLQIQVYNKGGSKPFELNMYKEEVLPGHKVEAVEYKFKSKSEAMKAKKVLLKYFNEVGDDDIDRGVIEVDAGNRSMNKEHEEIMKKFRPKVLSGRKINRKGDVLDMKEEVELDEAKFQVNYSKGGKLFSKTVNAKNEDDAEDKAIKQFKIEDDDIRSVVKEGTELDEMDMIYVLINMQGKVQGYASDKRDAMDIARRTKSTMHSIKKKISDKTLDKMNALEKTPKELKDLGIIEEVEMNELKMNDPKLNKIFDKLKPKSTVQIKKSSSIGKDQDFSTYLVVSKNTLRNGTEKITLKNRANPTGVKSFLYRRDGKVTFAIGDMGASIDDIKEALDKKDEPFVKDLVKKLRGGSKTHAKQADDLEKALKEKMDSKQIATLKKTFEPLRGKKISPSAGDKLMKIMDKIDKDKQTLIDLMKADIPFVSQLAVTRLISKHNMKGAEINKLKEIFNIEEDYELEEMAYKPGSFKDTRPQEKGAKAFDKLIQTGGLDKKDFQKAKQLYVQASDAGSREKLKKFIYNLDTEPTEAIMDLIGRNDPETFVKMYPKSKEGERLSTISYAHRNVKAEEVELDEDMQTKSYILDIVKAMKSKGNDNLKPFADKFKKDAMKTMNPKKSLEKVLPDYISGKQIANLLNMDYKGNEMTEKLTDGNLSLKETVLEMWKEAVSPAQQAAIAISKKERGEKPKKENNFIYAAMMAKKKGEKTFTIGGKEYDVEEALKNETNKNDKSDDGDGLDAVQPKAVKKKFADRKDKDIDNDGDVDSTDKYLHKRRKAISKAVANEEFSTPEWERYLQTKKGSLRDSILKVWGEDAHGMDKKDLTKDKKDGKKKMTDTGKDVTPVDMSPKMPKVKNERNRV